MCCSIEMLYLMDLITRFNCFVQLLYLTVLSKDAML